MNNASCLTGLFPLTDKTNAAATTTELMLKNNFFHKIKKLKNLTQDLADMLLTLYLLSFNFIST